MRKYRKLRAAMVERDMTGTYLAKKMGMGTQSFSNRMRGSVPWSVEEAYGVLRLLGLPQQELSKYFPPFGAEQE